MFALTMKIFKRIIFSIKKRQVFNLTFYEEVGKGIEPM